MLDDDFGRDDKITQGSIPLSTLPQRLSRQVVPQSAGVGMVPGPPGPPIYTGPYYPWVKATQPIDTYFVQHTPQTNYGSGRRSPSPFGRSSPPPMFGMNQSPHRRSPSPFGGPPMNHSPPPMMGGGYSPMGRHPSPGGGRWHGSPTGIMPGTPLSAGRMSPTMMGGSPYGGSPYGPMGGSPTMMGGYSPMHQRPGGYGYGGWNGM
eukprot:NODE_228_length_1131_cov_479.874502_g223_i0.p1 GENE.NODE_228_length_1131_cov_479.874502_g223_i0~~NODE_228_length_1131_cov_479.874502_g223_i0.p1  ORF type:complete len:205 (-),score=69.73 NODE_228_length_1131_cov_479.874502_g223_i0:200-814(-)